LPARISFASRIRIIGDKAHAVHGVGFRRRNAICPRGVCIRDES